MACIMNLHTMEINKNGILMYTRNLKIDVFLEGVRFMKNIERYKGDILNTELTNITCCVNHLNNKGICFENCKECKERAMKWLLEEYSDTILDDAERKYLSAVIKPFRNRVTSIEKRDDIYEEKRWILIVVGHKENVNLPHFRKATKYKGMKVDKKYTPEELGL